MNELFLKIINMSISASWLVLAVLILRLALQKAPKWIRVLLWSIVAVRLICPFSMENVVKALRCDPLLYGAVGLNILTGRVDVMKPMWWEKDSSTMNDTDFNYLMLYLESRYGLNNENYK